jgi:hypothetical protein
MKLGPFAALALSSAFLTTAAPAVAQQWPTTDPAFNRPDGSLVTPPEAFGMPGQMAISSDFDIDLRYVSETGNGPNLSGPDITVAPSVMFFLAPRLAAGGILAFTHKGEGDLATTRFTFGPIAAYNLPISERASLFPAVGITYFLEKSSRQTGGGRMSNSRSDISLLIKAPILFHPFRHVFVGFGPIVIVDFVAKTDVGTPTRTRSFGLTLDLGFWL